MLILLIFSPLTLRKGSDLLDADAEIEVMAHVGLGPSVSLVSLLLHTQSQTCRTVLVRAAIGRESCWQRKEMAQFKTVSVSCPEALRCVYTCICVFGRWSRS